MTSSINIVKAFKNMLPYLIPVQFDRKILFCILVSLLIIPCSFAQQISKRKQIACESFRFSPSSIQQIKGKYDERVSATLFTWEINADSTFIFSLGYCLGGESHISGNFILYKDTIVLYGKTSDFSNNGKIQITPVPILAQKQKMLFRKVNGKIYLVSTNEADKFCKASFHSKDLSCLLRKQD